MANILFILLLMTALYVIIGGKVYPDGVLCQVVSSLPDGVEKWAHYKKPIISGRYSHTNTEGVKQEFANVNQTYRISDKEPHRKYSALYRRNNVFQLDEEWAYTKTGPSLSQTYYKITSTDDGGRDPQSWMIISMPPLPASEVKSCMIDFVNPDNRRTFVLQMYVNLLQDANGVYY